MTIEEVRQRVEIIRRTVDDDERAHALEDALMHDVVRYFAASGNQVALEALESLEIPFSRWCA